MAQTVYRGARSFKRVTVVVAGREPPRWAEAPRLPISDFDLEHVGELSDTDALTYLELAGIGDPALQQQLCDDARIAEDRIHPLSLGLGADLALACDLTRVLRQTCLRRG
jgi:hypothetical protein